VLKGKFLSWKICNANHVTTPNFEELVLIMSNMLFQNSQNASGQNLNINPEL